MAPFDATKVRRTHIERLSMALSIGVTSSELHTLQTTPELSQPIDKGLPLKIAGLSILGLIAGGLLVSAIPNNIPIPEVVRAGLDLAFTPGNAPVPDATVQSALHAAIQWLIYAIESAGIITYAGSAFTDRLGKIEEQNRLRELFTAVENARKSGELRLQMGPHVAVNLGEGDAIGASILTELGVGTRGLPYSEVDKDVSGFDDIWAHFKLPKTPEEKKRFFAYLDSVGFKKAVGVVLCPVKADEAFAPDIADKKAFDLSMSEIFERIDLMDEYVLSHHKGQITLKGALIIGDEHIQVSLGRYRGKSKSPVKLKSYTLREEVKRRNKLPGRTNNISSSIDVVDTTDTILKLASQSLDWNPNKLPLAYISDLSPQALAYAKRIEVRCKTLNIPFTNDERVESLNLVHGTTDTEIKHAAQHLDPKTILPIVISAMFAPQSPYIPMFLTEVITAEAISRMKKMQWIE